MPGTRYPQPPTERFHESADWCMRVDAELDRFRQIAEEIRKEFAQHRLDHLKEKVDQAERAHAGNKEPHGGTDTMAPGEHKCSKSVCNYCKTRTDLFRAYSQVYENATVEHIDGLVELYYAFKREGY